MNRSDTRGSVLVIVLILMVIAISLATFIVRLSRDITCATKNLQDKLHARLETESTLEKLKYTIATGRFHSWYIANQSPNTGLPDKLNLRGRPLTIGNSTVQLQDTGGRLGLWPPSPFFINNLLIAGGIKEEEVRIFHDSLLDWIDRDDLKHLNGAERYYYRTEHGRSYQPRNDQFLQSAHELALIRGATPELLSLISANLVEARTTAININTANAPLLAAALKIDLAQAEQLLLHREKTGYLLSSDISRVLGIGLTIDEESITIFPSFSITFNITTTVGDARDIATGNLSFKPTRQRPYTVESFHE